MKPRGKSEIRASRGNSTLVAAASAAAAAMAARRRRTGDTLGGPFLHDAVAAGDYAAHRLSRLGIVGEGCVFHALLHFKIALSRAEGFVNVRGHSGRLAHRGGGSNGREMEVQVVERTAREGGT